MAKFVLRRKVCFFSGSVAKHVLRRAKCVLMAGPLCGGRGLVVVAEKGLALHSVRLACNWHAILAAGAVCMFCADAMGFVSSAAFHSFASIAGVNPLRRSCALAVAPCECGSCVCVCRSESD